MKTDMGGMCSCDLYDHPSIYHEKIVRGRKEYTCYECGGQISTGEPHEVVSVLYDGSWYRYRTHQSCAGIRRDFCCNVHGSVAEVFKETYGFSPWKVPGADESAECVNTPRPGERR